MDGRPDYSKLVPCVCIRAKLEVAKKERLLKTCELPSKALAFTFETFELLPGLEEAYDAALDLAERRDENKWLLLMGSTGRGKTHLLIAICHRWLQAGTPARYAYVPLLLDELRRGFRGEGDNSYDARFDFFLNVPLLALDDLGTENRTPWVQERLDTIIDYRLMHELALVVTTNLPMEEVRSSSKSGSSLQLVHLCLSLVMAHDDRQLLVQPASSRSRRLGGSCRG
jgi:DNA replication protein DnaC